MEKMSAKSRLLLTKNYIIAMIGINILGYAMVASGQHIAPHVVAWGMGLLTAFLLNSALCKAGLGCLRM